MGRFDNLTDEEFAELVRRSARLPDAPAEAIRAAIELWPASRGTLTEGLAEAASRFIQAVLSFDSWAGSGLAYGMRSAESDTRHLLFSAGTRDVDLRINRDAEMFTLTGQILGPDESGSVELVTESPPSDAEVDENRGGEYSRRTTLDPLGEFRLEDISAGTYRLTLRLGSDAVVLHPIVVGERPE